MEHAGEAAVQARAGVRVAPWGSARVGGEIPPAAAAFLAEQSMVVIGTAADDGAMWASALTGPAGFVTAPDDATVLVDRLPGQHDPLAGVFDVERDVGLIAIDLATRRRMRVNGRGHRSGGRLEIRTEQVYANCPKYIQAREPVVAEPGPTTVRRGEQLTAEQQQLISRADTFFVATRADRVGADVSHRGGNPGFVAVTDARRLSWPEYSGNLMYMTLGNLELDPRCGLLFPDWDTGATLHLTGRARVDWDARRAGATAGAQQVVDLEIEQVVQVDGASPLRWTFGGYSRFNPT